MESDTKPIYGWMQYPHMDLFSQHNPIMDIHNVIAANLSAWMEESPALCTMKKVAVKSGVGFGTIQRIKNGEGNITAKNLALIAAAFGRHPAELMIAPEAMPARLPDAYAIEGTSTRLNVSEPVALPVRNEREKVVDRINELLPAINDFGLGAVMQAAKEAAKDYPIASGNLARSSA